MARTLVIGSTGVRFEEGKELGCQQSSWQPRPTTWGSLIAKSFPRRPGGGRSAAATVEDFEVGLRKAQSTTAYAVCPKPGSKANRFPMVPWVALESPNRLALNLDNQTLLLLRRRPEGAKPTASFDCAKAAAPTEKAICGSFELASWDRSVALALRQAIERNPQREAELRQSQKEWLAKRDACGSDGPCIDEAQWRRVEDLRQE
jgi:uncharacterized protein YecT (DUF1311 family)